MTENPQVAASSFRAGRLIVGVLSALVGHGLAFGAAYVAGRVTTPSPGGGFEDLAAAAGVFVLAEAIIGLACLIAGSVLFATGRRDLGLGVAGGWVLGMVAAWSLFVA